ncbi:MAG: hypothetical protein LBT46_05100 [Planctomycetaceae bacterium]|nr:hypothetical protein [Planctomycetaceae bacterium]
MIVGVNRNKINAYYQEIRERIFRQTLQESGLERKEFELDESSLGAKRVRGKLFQFGKKPYGCLKKNRKCSKIHRIGFVQDLLFTGELIRCGCLLNLLLEQTLSKDEYGRKIQELRTPKMDFSLSLENLKQNRHEIADIAVKSFELSQILIDKWNTANYVIKR